MNIRDEDYRERTARFVRWLIEQRQAAQVTQKALCEASGTDRSYYSKIESGGRVPERPNTLMPVLKELSRLHGRDLVTEGLRLWGYPVPPAWTREQGGKIPIGEDVSRPGPEAGDVDDLYRRLLELPLRQRLLVSQLIDELAP